MSNCQPAPSPSLILTQTPKAASLSPELLRDSKSADAGDESEVTSRGTCGTTPSAGTVQLDIGKKATAPSAQVQKAETFSNLACNLLWVADSTSVITSYSFL